MMTTDSAVKLREALEEANRWRDKRERRDRAVAVQRIAGVVLLILGSVSTTIVMLIAVANPVHAQWRWTNPVALTVALIGAWLATRAEARANRHRLEDATAEMDDRLDGLHRHLERVGEGVTKLWRRRQGQSDGAAIHVESSNVDELPKTDGANGGVVALPNPRVYQLGIEEGLRRAKRRAKPDEN